jgi:RNA polymerase sigma-70 factor (ECF subfamily)
MDTTSASLLLRIRDQKDSAAWGQFDTIYRPILRQYARSRGLHDDQVEDVVQHCMLAVSQHIASFEYDPARGKFKAWLRTIVNNQVNKLRRQPSEQLAGTQVLDGMENGEVGPDSVFEEIWQREHLRHCLEDVRAKIEEATYRAFRAYALEEQPVEKVCADLNMTRNQVQLIKWRVTQMLRERMRELQGDDE